jgi:hypothetical protein
MEGVKNICGEALLMKPGEGLRLVDHRGNDFVAPQRLPELLPKVITVSKKTGQGGKPLELYIPHIVTVNHIREEDIKVVWDNRPESNDFFEALGGDWTPGISKDGFFNLSDQLTQRSRVQLESIKDRVSRRALEWNSHHLSKNGGTYGSVQELEGELSKHIAKESTAAVTRFRQNSDRFGTTLAREALLSLLSLEEDGTVATWATRLGLPAKTQANRIWLALDLMDRLVERLMHLHGENKELKLQIDETQSL